MNSNPSTPQGKQPKGVLLNHRTYQRRNILKSLNNLSTSNSSSFKKSINSPKKKLKNEVIIEKDSPEYLIKLINSIFQKIQRNNTKDAAQNNNTNTTNTTNSRGYSSLSPKISASKTFEQLPALTSSTNVDMELYAFIGLLLQQFVFSWYSRISFDYKGEFSNELIGVVAHMTRNIQQRIRAVDWGVLLFDKYPVIFMRHMNAIRLAKEEVGSRFSDDFDDDPEKEFVSRFIAHNPHFAMTLDDYELTKDLRLPQDREKLESILTKEKQYSRLLTSVVVSMLLPMEELDSELTKSILVSILNDLVLKNLIESLTDGFMIWSIVGSIMHKVATKNANKETDEKSKEDNTVDNPEKESKKNEATSTSTSETSSTDINKEQSGTKTPDSPSSAILDLKTKVYAKIVTVCRICGDFIAYTTSASIFNKSKYSTANKNSNSNKAEIDVLHFSIFAFLAELFSLATRIPFLFTIVEIIGIYCSKLPRISRLANNALSNFMGSIVLRDSTAILLIRSLRKMFFPTDSNFMTEDRFIPTTEKELFEAKESSKLKIKSAFENNKGLQYVFKFIYANDDNILDDDIESFLDSFNIKFINKHLMWNLLDTIFTNLFPELTSDELPELFAR
ncbi:hypothetical protein B5S28_g739 [[Candida] boidinii]|nr:hypothetical protein B5S28_g739 [[Candida] boidinii]OWB77698.1 hypothetical protein B5S32_g1872 [[Candida] boidinii]